MNLWQSALKTGLITTIVICIFDFGISFLTKEPVILIEQPLYYLIFFVLYTLFIYVLLRFKK